MAAVVRTVFDPGHSQSLNHNQSYMHVCTYIHVRTCRTCMTHFCPSILNPVAYRSVCKTQFDREVKNQFNDIKMHSFRTAITPCKQAREANEDRYHFPSSCMVLSQSKCALMSKLFPCSHKSQLLRKRPVWLTRAAVKFHLMQVLQLFLLFSLILRDFTSGA